MFKKLFGLGLVIIISGIFVVGYMNKPEKEITDEEAVRAYIVARDGEGDYEIKIGDNPTFGDDCIAYTVYKNGEIMSFGEIQRSYAQEFVG